ncbi:hypothetical protein RJ639_005109 [Escallonia herrerae]|uniref:RING-type E3 ubiquitin transferase n=1 Tax=Escallonia herrerae TaxID=1293975 RepID=A0AA88W3Y1_9ASTE|nr:hypothetical protein RJ639_005109 [Escallonia herrerae]
MLLKNLMPPRHVSCEGYQIRQKITSFVFRGTRPDIESGVSGYHPERRTMRVHASWPVNTNSFAFLVTVLLLFIILNSNQISPNFLLWLVLGVFLMATSLRMYATWQHLQDYYQAHAAAASGLLGHTELRLHIPPSVALATRGRLQGLRLQLALLDREFDDLDYDTLRALDSDNVPSAFSMSDEEINALPVHMYKVACPQSGGSIKQQASSSGSAEKNQIAANSFGGMKASEDELTCSVCLEQVITGELVRSLPCLHQEGHFEMQVYFDQVALLSVLLSSSEEDPGFHASCIDPWLRQQGTCPVCKYRAGSGWRENAERAMDASHLV